VPRPLRLRDKLQLTPHILASYVMVTRDVRRRPLPAVVATLREPARTDRTLYAHPRRLGQLVYMVLRFGPLKARCLFTSLVLFRLLREQGDDVELVIGLPREPRDKDAHAWLEIGGVDVGPPPGKGRHEQIARYS
jgi:hypothetical protein